MEHRETVGGCRVEASLNAEAASTFDIRGKIALVTGASSGLGRHMAIVLARAGARVVALARRLQPLTDLETEIRANGGEALALTVDITDRANVVNAVAKTVERYGSVDILVNNAGIAGSKRALDYDEAEWQQTLNTNLSGAWRVSQEVARHLILAGRGGSFINISSVLASGIVPGTTPYSASKAALRQLTRGFALELARYGIRVNSLAPGYVITDLNRDFLCGPKGEALKQRNPMRRFAEYADLDGPLLLLASDAGRYMTGAEIVVDGGHLCASL
jgi:NAD(P)-dependent dehydrogenase (short-subunit alcohol dehydrogenase family)